MHSVPAWVKSATCRIPFPENSGDWIDKIINNHFIDALAQQPIKCFRCKCYFMSKTVNVGKKCFGKNKRIINYIIKIACVIVHPWQMKNKKVKLHDQ